MNIELSLEALEYGRLAQRALEAAGGDQLVQRAERDPGRRADIMAPVFAELGAWELNPRGDADDLEAAAALCRAAGYWGLGYPVAERLARPADPAADGLVVIAAERHVRRARVVERLQVKGGGERRRPRRPLWVSRDRHAAPAV